MPRQIVPVTDVASILLTQDEGDLRYLPIGYVPPATDLSNYYTKSASDSRFQPVGSYSLTSHNHDAAYSPVAHTHTGTYLPLTGGTLTGPGTIIVVPGFNNAFQTKLNVAHAEGTFNVSQYGSLSWGPGGSSGPDVYLTRDASGGILSMTGSLRPPVAAPTYDLGATDRRWKKYWGATADLTPATKSDLALNLAGQAALRATASSWHPDWATLEVGRAGFLRADDSATAVTLAFGVNGIYAPDAVGRAKIGGGGTMHVMSTTQWVFYAAASVGAGATQNHIQRMTMDLNGTMVLYPAPATNALVTTVNTSAAVLLQSGGGIQFNDSLNNYGMGWRMRGSPVVMDVTYLGNNTGAYFDSTGGLSAPNLLSNGPIQMHGASSGMRWYHRDNDGLYFKSYAAAATWRLYESGYGDAMTFNRSAGGLIVFNAEGSGTNMRLGSAYTRAGVYSSANMAVAAEGVLQLYSYGSNIHLSASAGVMHPLTDNVMMCGYPSYRFTSICAVSGTINTSHVSSKRNIELLDPDACVQAVLETDWTRYEYLPPAMAAPHIPEGKTSESFEDRKARLLRHTKFVEETAHHRKQNGYVLGSPDHKVSDLFGLADRESASDHADLGILACALQAALKRIAALEGKAA